MFSNISARTFKLEKVLLKNLIVQLLILYFAKYNTLIC